MITKGLGLLYCRLVTRTHTHTLTHTHTHSIDDQSAIIPPAVYHQLLAECHEVMCASCDLIHARCAKILSIRAKAGLLEDLIPSEFVSLVRIVEKFVNTSTLITGRNCPQLRSSLLSQVSQY